MEENIYNPLDYGLNQYDIEKIREFCINNNALILSGWSSEYLDDTFKNMFKGFIEGKK